MEFREIFAIVALFLALLSGGLLFFFLRSPKERGAFRSLMGSGGVDLRSSQAVREGLSGEHGEEVYESLKKQTRRQAERRKEAESVELKLFQAGIISPEAKKRFARWRIVSPVIGLAAGSFVGFFLNSVAYLMFPGDLFVVGAVMGLLVGIQAPVSILDRRKEKRDDELLYYLPLVIEQIAIGVSSSLDIGPCLQRIVDMADERDSHNPVTELIRFVQSYVKSGVSLEEALSEVAKMTGHTELKHAFLSLAQVSRHGGEISKQLQELADAVAQQRETAVEGKIKKLELVATGPVALVFMGFLLIILTGFGIQIKNAF